MALNPIAYTERVVGSFLRYQLSAYPFADPELAQQLRALLSLEETRRTPLLQGPFISLSQSFRQGAKLADLATGGVVHPFLPRLVPYRYLYAHQEEALRAILRGDTTLVSTGTGSGKTECFLYPIVDRCLRLRDQNAPAGIVAVIVYPMNALAEDQLSRLRDLLAGTGISFGMYVGKTPERAVDVQGRRLPAGASQDEHRTAVERAQRDRQDATVHPPEERCSREEMRAPGAQPRILLTNVKQLELLLTRESDGELFSGARLDFLVFDEAHTFSGAMGAETACLIRRLRSSCARPDVKTVCVATSATLADPARSEREGRAFATRFFGVSGDAVTLVTEAYEADAWSEHRTMRHPSATDLPGALQSILEAVDTNDDGLSIARVWRAFTGRGLDPANWQADLYQQLAANDLVYVIAQCLLERPRALGELLDEVCRRVERPVTEAELLAWLALGAAARSNGRPLLRPVVHAFVRGIGGAVVAFPEGSSQPKLWLTAEDALPAAPRRTNDGTTGVAAEAPERALPVMTCNTCGQHYFEHRVNDLRWGRGRLEGGDAVDGRVVWRGVSEGDLGSRVVLFDRLISDVAPEQDLDEDEPEAPPTRRNARAPKAAKAPRAPKSVPMGFCRYCGALHDGARQRCDGCGRNGPLVMLQAAVEREGKGRPMPPGTLARCLTCGASARAMGSRVREPCRPVRAVTVSDVFVLAQDMIRHAERKRLLVFADNRQDAAFQAGWMQDHARRFRLRALMAERIREGALSVGDLAVWLDLRLDRDDELSRALVPEVWDEHRKEVAGLEHGKLRKRFLRIHVLREITTHEKQRVGLEPWGRLRVEYLGLVPEHPWIVARSIALGIPAARFVEGVANLLDHWRRGRYVFDAEGRIFSRFWRDGDYEIQRGFLPLFEGGPRAMRLQRSPGDRPERITQLVSDTEHDTSARQVVRAWGIAPDAVDELLRSLWTFLTEDLRLMVRAVLTGANDRPVSGCSEGMQIDADRLRIAPHQGLWRCRRCRRGTVRTTPLDRCPGWRCDGVLELEPEGADDYNLLLIDRPFEMLRPREHSAQVPDAERERLEKAFKGQTDRVNTLVCTPTLEMGVDIGGLDAVLLRNVPPLPANYRQRVGRAGRRHRMAVNITYARATSHDRSYFAAPLKILQGAVEPPRFNLRNELMVARHVRATVLMRLRALSRSGAGLGDEARREIVETVAEAFPKSITPYLFDAGPRGGPRLTPYSLARFEALIARHRGDLVSFVRSVFTAAWPAEDRVVITDERITAAIDGCADALRGVLATLKRRLDWALDQMRRLDQERVTIGTLGMEEDALYLRCDRLVKRYKGALSHHRHDPEGVDDVWTFSVLAAEGFLPGYGLETGAIRGTAIFPKNLSGTDFPLPRPTALAVREYVPGNLIYANGHRWIARRYHLDPSTEPMLFQVDSAHQAVTVMGSTPDSPQRAAVVEALGAKTLSAIAICDVELPHRAHISDDEDHRFQLPVAVYGQELGRHGGGAGFQWGARDLQLRRAVRFRLVNVGAVSRVEDGALGYPLCTVCGQSRSPFSSDAEQQHFRKAHTERCGQEPGNVGFFADVTADAMSLPGCADRDEVYSVLEALRAGASQVLEMEHEDLDLLVIGTAGSDAVDGVLYDPMPGGSGLLDQLCARFGDVVAQAIRLVEGCPARCERACIDCLFTFRNGYFHRHLDRHAASRLLRAWGGVLSQTHEIPAREEEPGPRPGAQPTNAAESMLRALLQRAGFPEARWQQPINLGRPDGSTTPDAFFTSEDPYLPGVCIYLDGLGMQSHGDPTTRAQDRRLRDRLRSLEYEVVEIAASELDDRDAMARHFYRIANMILDKPRAREIRERAAHWFTLAASPPEVVPNTWERILPRLPAEVVALAQALQRASVAAPDDADTVLGHGTAKSYRAVMAWMRSASTISVVCDALPRDAYGTCVLYTPDSPVEEVVATLKKLLDEG